MILGIVKGEIVSTINHPVYDNRRLLIVDRVDEAGQNLGGYLIAIAAIEAGIGDQVLVLDEGNGARQVINDPSAPVRSVVIGIVDAIELQ